uniref:Uncharacterized protein n=1 Tax=Cucumis melo TaxID=3656 RepID=A0A9I9CIE9_CUCME
MRKTDLIEVRLKIRHNYTGFIPAQINIMNSKGNISTFQTVSYTEGRWFKKRNANIHGSFNKQVALEFNEFDFKAEKYSFMRFVVIPPEKKDKKQRNPHKQNRNSNKRLAILNSLDSTSKAIIISDNYDGGRGSDERLKSVISGKMDKGKDIMVFVDHHEELQKNKFPKRKVSFHSPKNKAFFYNPENALAKPLQIESPTFRGSPTSLDRAIKPLKISPPKATFIHQKKKSSQMIYKVKNNNNKAIELNAKQIVDIEKKEKAINLKVEMGNISPLHEEMEVEYVSSSDSPIMTPI